MTTQLNWERTNYQNTNGKQVLIAETKNYTFEIYREGEYAILAIWDDNGKVGTNVFCGMNDYTDAKNKAQQIENQANNNN